MNILPTYRSRKTRGGWYLAVQFLLFLLVVFGPASWPGCRFCMLPQSGMIVAAGMILAGAGGILGLVGAVSLGRNLTPFPRPKQDGELVTTGAYSLVRHPIYSGIIFMALGWALWRLSLATLAYSLLLFLFLDMKSRREEQWLVERFPEYEAYRKRVRRLIPFVY